MPYTYRQGKPISFGLKIGAAVIVLCLIIGFVLKQTKSNSGSSTVNSRIIFSESATENAVLAKYIRLPVPGDSSEAHWSNALAKYLNGETEVRVDRGRVDIVTEHYAIEVDPLRKWHEGLGQAMHYADELERIGVLALILPEQEIPFSAFTAEDIALVKKIQRLALESGVLVILLGPAKMAGT